jgi:hypothetical protein
MSHTYQVGDAVGYGFNGDRYAAGHITRITARFIYTDTGEKFTRSGDYYHRTGMKSWWMSPGHEERQNPHF